MIVYIQCSSIYHNKINPHFIRVFKRPSTIFLKLLKAEVGGKKNTDCKRLLSLIEIKESSALTDSEHAYSEHAYWPALHGLTHSFLFC